MDIIHHTVYSPKDYRNAYEDLINYNLLILSDNQLLSSFFLYFKDKTLYEDFPLYISCNVYKFIKGSICDVSKSWRDLIMKELS